MKIWIDALTPKQLRFAFHLRELLQNKSYVTQVLLTSRNYSEAEKQIRILNLEAEIIGDHGGGGVPQKLQRSIERTKELFSWAQREQPDILFHFLSPEACRIAFGLGLPVLAESDSPHATVVSKLSVPLSDYIFTPWVIPKRRWTQYGIASRNIITFKALDPFVWLGKSALHEETIQKLRLRNNDRVVLWRTAENQAAYYRGLSCSQTDDAIFTLAEQFPDFRFIVMTRYETGTEGEEKERNLLTNIEYPSYPIDGFTVLNFSTLFVGSGGTMNQEAALIGVPNISTIPPDKLDVARNFYIPKKLMISALTKKEVIRNARSLLKHPSSSISLAKKRALKAIAPMKDPLPAIEELIRKIARDRGIKN